MATAEQMDDPSQGTKDNGGIDISKEILSKFKKSESTVVEIYKAEKTYFTNLNDKSKSKSKAGSAIKPKRTFTPADAPDKMKVGDRIKYRSKKPKKGASIYNDPDTFKSGVKKKSFYTSNVRKALTASCGVGAPSTRTQGATLQKEDMSPKLEKVFKKKKVLKSLSDEAWKNYQYKDELIEFVSEKQPDMNKNEVLAISKTYAYIEQIKSEKTLEDL